MAVRENFPDSGRRVPSLELSHDATRIRGGSVRPEQGEQSTRRRYVAGRARHRPRKELDRVTRPPLLFTQLREEGHAIVVPRLGVGDSFEQSLDLDRVAFVGDERAQQREFDLRNVRTEFMRMAQHVDRAIGVAVREFDRTDTEPRPWRTGVDRSRTIKQLTLADAIVQQTRIEVDRVGGSRRGGKCATELREQFASAMIGECQVLQRALGRYARRSRIDDPPERFDRVRVVAERFGTAPSREFGAQFGRQLGARRCRSRATGNQ